MNLSALDPAIKYAVLSEPVTLSGAFTLWAKIERPTNADVLGLVGETGENAASIAVGDCGLGIAANNAGGRGNIDDGLLPAGVVALRVRRDTAGEVYFAWEGRSEFVPYGPSPFNGTIVFDVVRAGRTCDSSGPIDGFSAAGTKIHALRIEAGELTTAERAAIETELFGFTL